jgi:hypothetical protein
MAGNEIQKGYVIFFETTTEAGVRVSIPSRDSRLEIPFDPRKRLKTISYQPTPIQFLDPAG